MKTLREALFNKKNLNSKINPYGITKYDMIGQLKGFPIGVVVRMMELQEEQGRESNISVFQKDKSVTFEGFTWGVTDEGFVFWDKVIEKCDFDLFFRRYPEYKKYN